jgi:cytoskeletal protein RodZ
VGISDDIQRKRPKKTIQEEVPVHDSPIKNEDVTDIIEPLPDTYESNVDLKDTHGFFAPAKESKEKTKPSKKTKSLWLVILLILLVLLLISVAVYQNLDLIKRKILKTPDNSTTTQTKEVNLPATDTASTQPTQDSSQTSTPTATDPATTQPATPVPIDKQSFTIRVSNGNGLKASADKVGNILTTAGFKVVSVGNAGSYGYKTTIIYYKSGKDTQANMVKDALSSRSVSTELSTTLKTYDILVIVGSK